MVVLAAGYGTRLERDINQDESGRYSSLRGVPKPLVPVGGKPLLDRWMEEFQGAGIRPERVHVVTNAKFHSLFSNWAKKAGVPAENVVNDGSLANEDRLGAVADLELIVEKNKLLVERDLVVVAGDTLFVAEFSLSKFLEAFGSRPSGAHQISYYLLENHEEVAKRGIVELRPEDNKVINFLEKPKPSETTSDCAVPPLYVYSKATMRPLLREFVHEHAKTRDERDAPGQLVAWLHSRAEVFATLIPGRFDIGGLADYALADQYFTKASS